MAVELKLPDLGEGIEDATISRWLVKEGDEVKEGDVVLEVATDKVDTEVPAPAGGKLLKVNFGEGSLVPVGSVLGVIGAEGEQVETQPAGDGGARQATPEPRAAPAVPEEEPPAAKAGTEAAPPSENGNEVKASPVAKRVAADKGIALDNVAGTGPGGRITKDDVLASADGKGKRAAPEAAALPGDLADVPTLSVRRLAAENNIDLEEIAGGRPLSTLTRYDVLSAVASRAAGKPVTVEPGFAPQQAPQPAAPPAAPASRPEAATAAQPKTTPPTQVGAREELVKHSRMRQAIARNTAASAFGIPHVTTVWEVNMAAVIAHRKAHKDEFAAAGVNLTITAYLIAAMIEGIKAVPAANSSYTDEGVLIKYYTNIGMAVALPPDKYGLGGLIVPVIKNAGDLNLMGLARAVNDLAERARANQLRSEDLQDGTITLTNYGTSGSRLQTPIIVQPQAAILGVGAIEKRPVVVSQGNSLEPNVGDYLAFLPMTTLALSYDHRVLDGATADAYCAAVKKALESWS
jgi:2-oxoglutarate dehydrogenase E2 component (dihydrolipoamide succinyltransferase)